MNCDVCKAPMRLGRVTNERPYQYRLSGLDNVYLVHIEQYICFSCGGISPIFPCLGSLHEIIAKFLVLEPRPLSVQEIRYLRKYVGMSWKVFLSLAGVQQCPLDTDEECIREHHKHLDRLARFLVVWRDDPQEAIKIVEDEGKQHVSLYSMFPLKLEYVGGQWQRTHLSWY